MHHTITPFLLHHSTTVDPTTTRQLASAAGMLRLHDKAAFLERYTLRDGKPHLLDAPVSGGVVAAGEGQVVFHAPAFPALSA
jgi:hypothetical protein